MATTKLKTAKKRPPQSAQKSKRKPASKAGRAALTPKQEAFTENYLANGGNGTEAARAAGYAGNDNVLGVAAYDNLRNPKIQEHVRQRLDGLRAEADEVLNLLADHLRGDLADFSDCIDEDGRLNLRQAKARGVSRLVKKLRTRTRVIPREDGEPIREITTEIEMYDAQAAAKLLADIHGIKQLPRENAADAERRRAEASALRTEAEHILDKYRLHAQSDEQARAWLSEDWPAAASALTQ